MKTGFMQGYRNKPVKKYYTYHGQIMDCLIQPGTGPYKLYETTEEVQSWIRFYGTLKVIYPYMYLKFKIDDILPSRWLDKCEITHPDGKERYYFLELYLQKLPGAPDQTIELNYGNTCGIFPYIMTKQKERIAMWFIVWAGTDWIFRYNFLKIASANKIWKTTNGNLNVNWPVTLEWKY